MAVHDFSQFQNKRLNPFKGLVIDVPVWTDAHAYHRNQHRLHSMMMHQYGIVTGLEVVAWDPPDNSVVIHPGIALDAEGNTIVVPEPQRFYLNIEEEGTAQLILQYSEVAQKGTVGSSNGQQEQAIYTLEAFRIREQRSDTEECYVELARVEVSGKGTAITDAATPSRILPFEIDPRYRVEAGQRPEGQVTIGILRCPASDPVDGWDAHNQGFMHLSKFVTRNTRYSVKLNESVELSDEIRGYDLLCLVGHESFELSDTETELLKNHLERGGTLFVEACSDGVSGEKVKGFRTSFSRMAENLGRTPRLIERGHELLSKYHLFAATPPGCDGQALMMENGGILYSDADYGCAWVGGRDDNPLPRDVIRNSLEFGANILIFAAAHARLHAMKISGR